MSLHRISVLLLLLLHLPTALLANRPLCLGGQIRIKDRCVDCPAGTFRKAVGPNMCIPCPPGSFNPFKGAGYPSLCRLCTQNTFAPEAGAIACQPCPQDTVAIFGSRECTACGPGYKLSDNTRTCAKCEIGSYSNRTAALECISCKNSTSPEGSTSASDCKPCPPGLSAPYGFCAPCLIGEFISSGMCITCPQGSVAERGATRCLKCPPGTFSRGLNKLSCRKCPPGFTSNGPGASRCRPIGSTRCPRDSFENVNGDCDKCRPGDHLNVKTRLCERCPPGFVSKGGVQEKCDPCLPSQTTNYEYGADCICPRGMWRAKNGSCRNCPPGTGGNYDGQFGRGGCIKCDKGTYSDKPGSIDCKPCPIGTIAGQEGSLKCTPCPSGSTSAPVMGGASECVWLRTGCTLGKNRVQSPNFDDLQFCDPTFCQIGTPEQEIGISCTPCSPGYFLKNGRCALCKPDEVSSGGIITSCTKCEKGFVQSYFDSSKCACDGVSTKGKGIQNGACKDCPPGMRSSINFSVCIPCPPGTVASEFGNARCRPCPAGTFSDTAGSTVCRKCPRGTKAASPTGAKACVPSA